MDIRMPRADEYVYESLRAGASGFMLKDVRPEQLADAVRVVARGEALLAPAITRRLIEDFVRRPPSGRQTPAELTELTERELARLEFHDLRHTFASLMVAAGANPLQIAEALGHSDKTGRPDQRSSGSATGISTPARRARRSLRLTAISKPAAASGAGYTRDGNGACAAACAKPLQIRRERRDSNPRPPA